MKFLLLVCSLIAYTSATYAPYGYPSPYSHYGYHVPVIGPNGVPLDTPEVQHAKAAHLSALAAAGGGHIYAPGAYLGHYGTPVIAHDGTPLDTPEVAAAKAHHFAAFHEAAARNGVYGAYGVGHAGPAETPEVQHAKAAHFAAHAEARARSGHSLGHYRKRRGVGAYPYAYGGYHVPVIGPHGVPIETPEVQHARAAHLAAHAEAATRGGYSGHDDDGSYNHGAYNTGAYNTGAYNNGAYNDGSYNDGSIGHAGYGHAYPLHYPVIGPNGVPVDTPEVQHARAAHFSALAEASSRSAGHGYYGGHY